MGQHTAGSTGLRRARTAAWIVFLAMAGTTMTFQVYHAVKYGQMPWWLAGLYGTVPLLISIGVLEVAAEWHSRWAQTVAYAVTGGAMYLSASATGEVTAHAAPSHAQLLFGLLMDAAALLAVHFILSGPVPGAAADAAAERESALRAQVQSERAASEETIRGLRAEVDAAASALASARQQAETLTRKLEAASAPARKPAGNGDGRKKPAAVTAETPAVPEDIDTQAAALEILAAEPGISGSELGRRLGKSDRYGRMLQKALAAGPSGQD